MTTSWSGWRIIGICL